MKHAIIQTEFLKLATNGRTFNIEPIMVGDGKLPGYNQCGKDCRHLTKGNTVGIAKGECLLFRAKLEAVGKEWARTKNCIQYTEGVT